MTEDELAERVGREFPGGTYTIEPWRAWLLADTVLADPPPIAQLTGRPAHPLFAWLVATGAMGIGWDELFTWFDATAADGPVFGEHETSWRRPMLVGETYRVRGGIVSAQRKVGRRTGPFDVVGYSMAVHDEHTDEHMADCWNSIVFPRRPA